MKNIYLIIIFLVFANGCLYSQRLKSDYIYSKEYLSFLNTEKCLLDSIHIAEKLQNIETVVYCNVNNVNSAIWYKNLQMKWFYCSITHSSFYRHEITSEDTIKILEAFTNINAKWKRIKGCSSCCSSNTFLSIYEGGEKHEWFFVTAGEEIPFKENMIKYMFQTVGVL